MNSQEHYVYPIAQCDILDKEKAECFRARRSQWIEWLKGKDRHAISTQLHPMLWNYALFCTVNELRRLARVEPQEGVGFNGPVIALFDAGFVATQAMAIRRLIERKPNDSKRAVISLWTVLGDLKRNIALFTRENYVCYDGVPYDYEAVHGKELSNLPGGAECIDDWELETPGPKAWATSGHLHQEFDGLSGVPAEKRGRTDLLKPEVFEFLERKLQQCEPTKEYVNKYIAHASAPQTREDLDENRIAITLRRLKACHKIIYRVASFVLGQLLGDSGLGGLAVPQYNHLANLEKAWATQGHLDKAHQHWREFDKEVSTWDSTPLWPPEGTA